MNFTYKLISILLLAAVLACSKKKSVEFVIAEHCEKNEDKIVFSGNVLSVNELLVQHKNQLRTTLIDKLEEAIHSTREFGNEAKDFKKSFLLILEHIRDVESRGNEYLAKCQVPTELNKRQLNDYLQSRGKANLFFSRTEFTTVKRVISIYTKTVLTLKSEVSDKLGYPKLSITKKREIDKAFLEKIEQIFNKAPNYQQLRLEKDSSDKINRLVNNENGSNLLKKLYDNVFVELEKKANLIRVPCQKCLESGICGKCKGEGRIICNNHLLSTRRVCIYCGNKGYEICRACEGKKICLGCNGKKFI